MYYDKVSGLLPEFTERLVFNLELLYKGKTKDVYQISEDVIELHFKDDVTGTDGKFDPGSNSVGLQIEGMGRAGLAMSRYFFAKLNAAGIPTHYIDSDLEAKTMTVKKAERFGKGLEVVCRRRAVGSFYRRYGDYIEEGAKLDNLVETTIKDDEREDPPLTPDTLAALKIMTLEEFAAVKALTQKLTDFIEVEMEARGLELYDIKFEFGRVNGQVLLIDEISAGNMRVYKDGKVLEPMELAAYFAA